MGEGFGVSEIKIMWGLEVVWNHLLFPRYLSDKTLLIVCYWLKNLPKLGDFFGRAKCQKIYPKPHLSDLQETQSSTLVIHRRDAKSGVWWTAIEQVQEVLLPVLVIVVGILCSIASLTTLQSYSTCSKMMMFRSLKGVKTWLAVLSNEQTLLI